MSEDKGVAMMVAMAAGTQAPAGPKGGVQGVPPAGMQPTTPPRPTDARTLAQMQLVIEASQYGTVFVRSPASSIDLPVEQVDRFIARLHAARDSGESSFHDGLHILAGTGEAGDRVELLRDLHVTGDELGLVLARLADRRAVAVKMRVAAAKLQVASAQAALDAAMKL